MNLPKLKLVVLWTVLCVFPKNYAQDRPNILWLTMEDTSPQFIHCYGNEDAETPVMDKMAEGGVRFTNAFSTGTVCSPSRSTIITGVPTYKLGTGHHRSSVPIPDFIKGFPEYLKNSGYYVTNNSKTDYNIANRKDFISATWNENSKKAGWWGRKPGQPFFSVFNINDSHQSRTMSMSYEWYKKHVLAHLKPEKVIVNTKNKEIEKETKLEINAQKGFLNLHEKKVIVDSAFAMPPIFRNTKAMRKQMARVYNSVKLADMKMGQILQRLKDDGLMDETIVFIFADHGQGIPRAKTNGIGLGYRVPFIMWFPEKYKHLSPWGTGGIVSDELIYFQDLAPTILNLAGVEIPEYMKGRSLPKKEREPAPDYIYLSSDRADNGIDMVRTITNGRFLYSRNFMPFFPEMKYIRYVDIAKITQLMREDYKAGKLNELQASFFEERPVEVLYDLKSDPWETNNLAQDPAYRNMISKMRDRLHKTVLEVRDVHFVPEYSLAEISEYTTPYEFRLNEEKYPLEEIFKTANLVGKTGGDIENRLFKDLQGPNKFQRYWAAMGLYAFRSNLDKAQLKEIKNALKDEYPPVQINLAALLYAETQDSKAKEILKKYILGKNEHLALSAINYTLYLKDRSAFISEVQEVHASDAIYKVKAAAEDFLRLEGMLSNTEQE